MNAPLPFMTAVAGHVMFHDGETGATLEDFTGLCTHNSITEFWKIYTSRGETAYAKLYAWTRKEAEVEARYMRLIRLLMSAWGIGFRPAFEIVTGASVDANARQRMIRNAMVMRHRKTRDL